MNYLQLLPGRLAVLVPDPVGSGIVVLPDAIRERWQKMGFPAAAAVPGFVVAAGPDRGRVEMPPLGAKVWIRSHAGLTIEHGDLDISSLGVVVPLGHSLRLLGVGEKWSEQVYGWDPAEFPSLVALTTIERLKGAEVAYA